uniref:Dynein regulatory complex protein 12 n=1 Tax=Trepomonas sp. PC1 TaxID=1076344 RepID=A0A146KDK5_9EUKA|eukprot:JAP93399.1 hypothetical protein TPC1_14337 [Trepomonas sp. PC1]
MSKKKDEKEENKRKVNELEIKKQQLETKLLQLAQDNAEQQQKIRQSTNKLTEIQNLISSERADSMDVTNEMARQFKNMQDELLKDIGEREKQIEQIRLQNQKEKESLQIEVESRNQTIAEKEMEVMSLKKRLDQLSREFSAILRETLAQIADKIENKADEAV